MLLLGSTRPAVAATVFFDDFSQDFTKWEATRDDGSYWTIQDGTAVAEVLTPFTVTELIPKDAYWNENWQDIRYSLDFTGLAGIDKNISFHFENLNNWYELHFAGGNVELVRVQNGTVPWSVRHGVSIPNGNTHHIEITLQGATISLSINDQHFFTQIDPTFNNNYGKVGIKAGTGSVVPTKIAIDNVLVETIETTSNLAVPLIKQTDPQWSENEYDLATAWSLTEPPTIGRWGCALTSLTMLFQYYGLTHFADGTPITPATFNNWLLSQPDGYIPDGNVNWLAATRLSRELSEQFGSPKLEFKRVLQNITTTLTEQLNAQQPTIVHIPSHFVVATGMSSNTDEQTDIYINDPGYSYTKLSEHLDAPLSLRTFTPSFTDLSYLLFATNTDTSITLKKQNDLLPLVTETEDFQSLETKQPKPKVVTYEFAKPESGEYVLELSGQPLSPYNVTVYFYTQDGSVQIENLTGMFGTQPQLFEITYSKSNTSDIRKIISFATLTREVTTLYQLGYISSPFTRYELLRMLTMAQTTQSQAVAILQQFKTILEKRRATITDDTWVYLSGYNTS